MSEEISDEELAKFLADEASRRLTRGEPLIVPDGPEEYIEDGPLWGEVGALWDESETVQNRVTEVSRLALGIEQRLRAAERRSSWLLGLVCALGIALGATELSLAIHSLH